jgi:hypothetical protein
MYHTWKKFSAVSLAALALIAWGCAEQGSSLLEPNETSVHASTSTSTVTVKTLLRDVPLESDLTRSWTVKRAQGATLDWPEVGLRVVVPAWAFSAEREMVISITAPKGDVVAYDFGPDGAVFSEPLELIQSTKGTNFARLPRVQQENTRGAYFKSITQVSDLTNTARVDEFEPTVIDVIGNKLTFKITHFSGYLLSTN